MNTEKMPRTFSRCDNGQSVIYLTAGMHGKHAGGLSFYAISGNNESSEVFHFTSWEARAFVKRVNREWELAKALGDLEKRRRPRNFGTLFPDKKEKEPK